MTLPTVVRAVSGFGEPLADLTAEEQARFEAGKAEFQEEETAAEGLGPVFNESACASCHTGPVGGTNGRTEVRFGSNATGSFDPLTYRGGSLLQDHAIGVMADGYDFVPEQVPPEANVVARRITTPLFGLGLVDAVPDEELLRLARVEAARSPEAAGTPHLVTEVHTGLTRVGRFGWKAQVPTLAQFSGDAYLNEMGVTSPDFPNESCPQGECETLVHNPAPGLNDDGEAVTKFTDFMIMLAPPPRGDVSPQVQLGESVFRGIGCAYCHTPLLVTGESPVAALSHTPFRPFSDFLLHDMGTLGDGIVQGSATGRQMRTAPLWGLRTRTALLHDGRATTIEDAINAHDGQGAIARDGFAELDPRARAALLAFLRSL